MKKARSKCRILSAIMTILILLVSLPTYALASLVPEDTSQGVNEEQIEETSFAQGELVVLEEDISLREENVKHFKLSNGTVKAVSYANAVHYLDRDGNWIDIDNSLTLNGSEYTANNKQEIKFANKSGSNGLLSIKDGEYKIDFTPLNTNKVSVEIENPQENNSRKFDDVKKLNNIVSRATYKGIYEGIDLEYILVGNNIKENIIVNKKQEEYTYSFEIKLSKLNATLENNMVVLTDSDTGEKVYEIPAPYMVDANGEYSDKVQYTLTKDSKWKYTFTVKADPEWINEEERQLPVKIDPTVIVNSNITDMNATFEYTKSSTGTITSTTVDITDNGALIVGNFVNILYDSIAFMKFNSLPELPAGTNVTNANLSFYVYHFVENLEVDGLNLGIYQAMAEWTYYTDRTISQEYSMFNDYCDANDVIGSVKITDEGAYNCDITELYNRWLSGASNNGFCLRGMNLPTDDNNSLTYEDLAAYIVASEGISTYPKPLLELTYMYMIGVEDYYAYAENTLGDVGKSYVNLYNGSLTYINNLTSIEVGPNLTYDIDMVHNSIEKTWTPSFAECIMPYDGEDDIYGHKYGIERYIWKDQDGTYHAFKPIVEINDIGEYETYQHQASGEYLLKSDPTVFYPEDDIDYVLIQTENNEFILRDYNGNQKMFDSQGRLSKICDAQGNLIHFSYKNGNLSCIDCVKLDNIQTPQVEFIYDTDNNKLSTIYIFATKLEISLTWNNGALVIIAYNDIDNTKDNSINISYVGSSNMIDKISDTLESKYLKHNLNTSEKVSSIWIYDNNDVAQLHNSIYYELGYTGCSDYGADLTSTLDNITNEYMFDKKGRKIAQREGFEKGGAFNLINTWTYNDNLAPDSVYYQISYSDNINNKLTVSGNEDVILRYDFGTKQTEFLNLADMFDSSATTNSIMDIMENISTEDNTLSANDFTIEDESSDLAMPSNIIGSDNRQLVDDTSLFPYSAICYVRIYFAGKSNPDRGTGFLIGPNTLLTAGHNLIYEANKALPEKIEIYPGGHENANGEITSPYEMIEVETCYIQKEYYDNETRDNDWGLCVLESNIGYQTSWLDLSVVSNSMLGEEICVAGFPLDLGRNMYRSAGTITSIAEHRFYYNADTEGGNSGSPVYLNNNVVIGIHTTGNSTGNGATKVNLFIYTLAMKV